MTEATQIHEGQPMVVTDHDGTEYSAVVDNLYPFEEKPILLVKFHDNRGMSRLMSFNYTLDFPPVFTWREDAYRPKDSTVTPQLRLL